MRVVWEGRWYASEFLKQVALSKPDLAGNSDKAAEYYVTISNLIYDSWVSSFSHKIEFSKENIHRWVKPENRRKLASILQQVRDMEEEEAIRIIKKLLSKINYNIN